VLMGMLSSDARRCACAHAGDARHLNDILAFAGDDRLDVSRFALHLPPARISELHFMLRSIQPMHALQMKRHGRRVYETYYGSRDGVLYCVGIQLTRSCTVHMRALLHTLRARVGVPAHAAARTHLVGVFESGRSTPTRSVEMALTNDPDEFVGTHTQTCAQRRCAHAGPIEPPLASSLYTHNFTQHTCARVWNEWMSPVFELRPAIPYTHSVSIADAQFAGMPVGDGPIGQHVADDTLYGYRPINNGEGGSGREFSQSLGGEYVREQFTGECVCHVCLAHCQSSYSPTTDRMCSCRRCNH
jgi:hypothetical protein